MTFDDLKDKASNWWNRMNGYDKNFYVKHYEGGVVPIASLTEGAIMRLYLKVFENLTYYQALEKYHFLKINSLPKHNIWIVKNQA